MSEKFPECPNCGESLLDVYCKECCPLSICKDCGYVKRTEGNTATSGDSCDECAWRVMNYGRNFYENFDDLLNL